MADIATLGFAVNSDPLAKASAELDKVAASATKTESASEKLGARLTELSRETNAVTASQKSAATTAAALGQSTATATAQAQASTKAATANAAATKSMSATQKAATASTSALAMSTKAHAAAMRQVPAQITDIVTSLISGQPAYLVAIQQGGQLKDAFGGIGPAARALLSALNPVTLAIGGIAAVLGAMAIGFAKGTAESNDLTRSLILTGNTVGQTTDSLNAMAGALDNVAGTQAKAAETIALLIAQGRVAGDDLQEFAGDAIAAERKLGLAVEDTAKQFAALAKDPVQASLKLNETLHYLSVSTLAQIQDLEKQGRATDAARVAQEAFANSLGRRAAEMQGNLGYVERAWRGVKDAISETGDALLGVGRVDGPAQQLAALQSRRLEQGRRLGEGTTTTDIFGNASQLGASNFQWVDNEERRLQAIVDRQKAEAEAAAEAQRAQDAAIAAQTRISGLTDQLATKQEQYNLALQQTRRDFEALKGTDQEKSAQEQARIIQRLHESIFGRSDNFGPQISAIQRALDLEVDSVENANTRLEALHAARRVSDEDYYDERKRLVQESADAQVAAINAENRILEQQAAVERARDGRADATVEKIRANQGAITQILQAAANEQGQITLQQQNAQQALARSYDLSRQAAQNALNVQARALQRQLDDLGSGPAARRYSSGLNSIDENVANQRAQLESQRLANQISPEQYQQQLGVLQEFHQQAITLWGAYYDQIEQKSADFKTGWDETVLSFLDSTKNVGEQLAGTFVSAIDQVNSSVSQLAAGFILFGEGGRNAVYQIARGLATELLASLIKVGLQMGTNFLLGQTLGAAALAATSAQAGAAAAIWSPAAVAASIATLGGASGIGLSAYTAALGAGQAATSATQAAGGALPGKRGGGYTGDGALDEVAGYHHAKEFVMNAPATARHRPLLEAMNDGNYSGTARRAPNQWLPNAGAATAAPAPAAPAQRPVVRQRIYNQIDKGEILRQVDTPEGEEIFVNWIGRNRSKIREAAVG